MSRADEFFYAFSLCPVALGEKFYLPVIGNHDNAPAIRGLLEHTLYFVIRTDVAGKNNLNIQAGVTVSGDGRRIAVKDDNDFIFQAAAGPLSPDKFQQTKAGVPGSLAGRGKQRMVDQVVSVDDVL